MGPESPEKGQVSVVQCPGWNMGAKICTEEWLKAGTKDLPGSKILAFRRT